jgi:hypothetical protein
MKETNEPRLCKHVQPSMGSPPAADSFCLFSAEMARRGIRIDSASKSGSATSRSSSSRATCDHQDLLGLCIASLKIPLLRHTCLMKRWKRLSPPG